MHDKNVFWRQNTQTAACYPCLPDIQYKSKPYYHLDDVSRLPEHAVNLLALMPCEAIRNKKLLLRLVEAPVLFSDFELTNISCGRPCLVTFLTSPPY